MRNVLLVAFFITIGLFFFLFTNVRPDRAQSAANWLYPTHHYRVHITITNGPTEVDTRYIEVPVNFTSLLSSLGDTKPLIEDSIRLAETDGNGGNFSLDSPFQFDHAADYNVATAAKGTLIINVPGNAPNIARNYWLYFDTAGTFQKQQVSPGLILTDNVTWQGLPSYKIDTAGGSLYYQKPSGGFAAFIDRDGKDWLGYKPGGGGAGEYRGIPNAKEDGEGGLHPGATNMTSTLVSQGPLKITISTVLNDGSWAGFYEIYMNYTRFTITKASHAYWFLYEGTPGGTIDVGSDYMILSDGSKHMAGPGHDQDIPAPEWAYFADGVLNRSLWVGHPEDDNLNETYWILDNAMHVFGFGREGATPVMNSLPGTMLFGMVESRDFETNKKLIMTVMNKPQVAISAAEKNGSVASPTPSTFPGTITPTGTAGCPRKTLGDADCNGTTSVTDYAVWRIEYKGGCTSTNLTEAACGDNKDGIGTLLDADFNNDLKATLTDYQIWRNNIQ